LEENRKLKRRRKSLPHGRDLKTTKEYYKAIEGGGRTFWKGAAFIEKGVMPRGSREPSRREGGKPLERKKDFVEKTVYIIIMATMKCQ